MLWATPGDRMESNDTRTTRGTMGKVPLTIYYVYCHIWGPHKVEVPQKYLTQGLKGPIGVRAEIFPKSTKYENFDFCAIWPQGGRGWPQNTPTRSRIILPTRRTHSEKIMFSSFLDPPPTPTVNPGQSQPTPPPLPTWAGMKYAVRGY